MSHDSFDQNLEMPDHAGDSGVVKEIAAVFDAADNPPWALIQLDQEVELRGAAMNVQLAQVPTQILRWQGWLHDARDLKQRILARRPLGPKRGHEFFKRHIRMLVGLCDNCFDPR